MQVELCTERWYICRIACCSHRIPNCTSCSLCDCNSITSSGSDICTDALMTPYDVVGSAHHQSLSSSTDIAAQGVNAGEVVQQAISTLLAVATCVMAGIEVTMTGISAGGTTGEERDGRGQRVPWLSSHSVAAQQQATVEYGHGVTLSALHCGLVFIFFPFHCAHSS